MFLAVNPSSLQWFSPRRLGKCLESDDFFNRLANVFDRNAAE